MGTFFQEHFPFPFHNPLHMFAPYMDLTAFVLTLLVTIVLAIGVKESSRMNNVGFRFVDIDLILSWSTV